ncbi:unnamed protein product [Phytomonas sp. Hart1]|nr:unnamed protein product [Phytomonas sp. Hart1]|eukprot:CCW66844.1 unnamed protein product [Phytomonas sp. isolate Hart1]
MDEYLNLGLIGEGSFGRVYKARIKGSGQIVAMKLIRKKGKNEKELRNLKCEIEILTKLKHDHIITLYDAFETKDNLVVIMEYAVGELFGVLEADKGLSEDLVQRIAKQLVQALQYIHNNRIIHRDIKPQNILLCNNGTVKLADFGFARSMSFNTIVLTSVKGTPLYMAPELIQEQPYDHRADLWSLGCILYELYYGKPPFSTNSLCTLISKITKSPVDFNEPISPNFKSLLEGLLIKQPSARLNWPCLLTHPFVSLTDADHVWLSITNKSDIKMKDRMKQLGCIKLYHVTDTICGNTNELFINRRAFLSDKQNSVFNSSALIQLHSGDGTVIKVLLTKMISALENIENALVNQKEDKITLTAIITWTIKLLSSVQDKSVLELTIQFISSLVFPEDGDVLLFPSVSALHKVTDLLKQRHEQPCIGILLRESVAMELIENPNSLAFVMNEVITNAYDSRFQCIKILFQCTRWGNNFGSFVQMKEFPRFWDFIFTWLSDTNELSFNNYYEHAALVLHFVRIAIPHIKLVASHHMNHLEVISLANREFYAICNYRSTDLTGEESSVAQLNYYTAAVLFVAFVYRDLNYFPVLTTGDGLVSGFHAIVNEVNHLNFEHNCSRILGSDYGYPEHGMLDGVVHMLSLIISVSKSLLCGKAPENKMQLFLDTYRWDFVNLIFSFLGNSDSHTELSISGVQAALRALQQILLSEPEKSLNLFLNALSLHSTDQGSPTLPISVICRQLHTDYLQQIYFWPESHGGGSLGVGLHITVVANILNYILQSVGSDTQISSKIASTIQRVACKEGLIEMLVMSFEYGELAFWGPSFTLIARLMVFSDRFAEAFVDTGGLNSKLIKQALDSEKANTTLILDALRILSQLAQLSEKYYLSIHSANLYSNFSVLVHHHKREIRRNMYILIGNLFKHSDFFYEHLIQNHLIEPLVKCCCSSNFSSNKFALFAVGNAAFHSDYLYEQLKPTIPNLIKLLSCSDRKTRQNAAGVLCNLIRNGNQLLGELRKHHAAEELFRIFKDGSLDCKRIVVPAVNVFCQYDIFKNVFITLGLKDLIEISQKQLISDPFMQKYIDRIAHHLNISC